MSQATMFADGNDPTPVISEPDRYVWALGPYRAEISRTNSVSWWLRIWHVWGPTTLDRGECRGLKAAKAEALSRLKAIAGATERPNPLASAASLFGDTA